MLKVKSRASTDRWIRELATALVQAGAGIYEMRRTGASLEEIFLELTTQEGVAEVNHD